MHVAAIDFTVAKLLAPQLDHLAMLGYEVRVACKRTDSRYWQELERFDPIDIPFSREMKIFKMLKASMQLSREVRHWRPDVLHLHTPAASLPVRALPHPRWAPNTSIVYTVHGYLHSWPPRGAKDRIIQLAEKWEARRTECLLFQSAEDYESSRQLNYHSNLILLGNGVEDTWFDLEERKRTDVLQLLFVGRLVREKGVLELLDAVAKVASVHLHIAGESLHSDRDPIDEEIAQRLTNTDLKCRVTQHGMLTRAELQQLYGEIDALALPSYREGVPRSVIEALAAGRPVIATDIRGCRELVMEGQNGWLVPPRQVGPLAEAIRKLSKLGEDSLSAMGQRAAISVDPERRESSVFGRLVAAYQACGATLST